MTNSEIQSRTAKLAYFFFLERVEKGLPGDEANDWTEAEEAMQKELSNESGEYIEAGAPLSRIKGIGPKAKKELEAVGIESVADLSAMSLAGLGSLIPRLASRAKSGRWIEQAQAFSTNAN